MFCSVKSDEGNDAVPHLSLRELNIYLHVLSGKFPWDPRSTF